VKGDGKISSDVSAFKCGWRDWGSMVEKKVNHGVLAQSRYKVMRSLDRFAEL
jgi:hypothetical protein